MSLKLKIEGDTGDLNTKKAKIYNQIGLIYHKMY